MFFSVLNSSFNINLPSISFHILNSLPSKICTSLPLISLTLVSISIASTTDSWFLNSGLSTAIANKLVYFSKSNLDWSIFLSNGFFLSCTSFNLSLRITSFFNSFCFFKSLGCSLSGNILSILAKDIKASTLGIFPGVQ